MVNDEQDHDSERDIEEALRACGTPEHVIAYVAESGAGPWDRVAVWCFLFVVFIGGVFGVALALLPFLEDIARHLAWRDAYYMQSVLWNSQFGMSIALVMLLVILWAGPLFAWATSRAPRLQVAAFLMNFDSVAPPFEGAAVSLMKLMTRIAGDERDPQRFIQRAAFGLVRPYVASVAALTVVAAGLLWGDLYGRKIYTQDYYARSDFLLPYQLVITEWRDATYVELGCRHGRKYDGPVYRVTFRDGHKTNLWGAESTKGSWLDGVEPIDRALRASGATFSAPNVDARCMAYFQRTEKPADYARLEKLLSVSR